MPPPEGWRVLRLGDAVELAVPPDAAEVDLPPVDSVFGVLRGEGYEVVYDYGRYGEDLADLRDLPGYTRRERQVQARTATDIAVAGAGDPWRRVRVLRVDNDRDQLTVRVSCVDDRTCALADTLFDLVRFTK
ncbi:hypothetical protein ADK67_37135 [Saccharothrix sp. NRRL B-16348]|uniref:hypothetical protein n=1 Tax=Saccharothrix sp. NRRL B-16348 TaxID=1415542 RepID=UPI0006B03305|nr:hypothetical protein [Saccharothrix sp. NRRL B-16348]KOX18416.1 hypothetical protein ADK67_37135 [Saccharothrix sp. NRRL B-16348]